MINASKWTKRRQRAEDRRLEAEREKLSAEIDAVIARVEAKIDSLEELAEFDTRLNDMVFEALRDYLAGYGFAVTSTTNAHGGMVLIWYDLEAL